MQIQIPVVAATILALAGCTANQKQLADAQAQIAQLRAENASLKDANERLAADLVRSGKSPVLSSAPRFDLSVPMRPGRQTPPDWKWTLDVNATNLVDPNSPENQTIYSTTSVKSGSGTLTRRNVSPTTLPTTKPASQK
jgi:hypothetical protein